MTSHTKTRIDHIRAALFDGRFTDASTMVDAMRQHDPNLDELGKSFTYNNFGLFSFSSWSTDQNYLSEQRLLRQKLVLSWISLPHQLDLFGLAIEAEDVSVDLLQEIKFNQITPASRNALVHLIGYWMAHQKTQESKYVMEHTGIALHEKVKNILLVYKTKNIRGALSLENTGNVPLYTVLAFNYTPQLFDFVRAEGITVDQISSTFACVDASESRHVSDVLTTYKNTQFLTLKSHVEHLNITQSLENLDKNEVTHDYKKTGRRI